MDTETPDSPPAPHWTWCTTPAGGVAAGVLAASVAVPVTWATLRGDDTGAATSAATRQTTSASGDGLAELPGRVWSSMRPGWC